MEHHFGGHRGVSCGVDYLGGVLMLSTQEIQEVLSRISYKPGWSFICYDGVWEGQHLVVRTSVPDAYDDSATQFLDVHSMLPPIPDVAYLVKWLMWRLNRIETHEMREFFRLDGQVVDDPHAPGADRDNPDYRPEADTVTVADILSRR